MKQAIVTMASFYYNYKHQNSVLGYLNFVIRCVVSLGDKHCSTLSLIAWVYKWVLTIIIAGCVLTMDWHPIQGGGGEQYF